MKRKLKNKKLSLDQARRVAKITSTPVEVILKWTLMDVFNKIREIIGEGYRFELSKCRKYKLIDTKNPSRKPSFNDWVECEDNSIKQIRTRKRIISLFFYIDLSLVPGSTELYEQKRSSSPALTYYTTNFTEGCIKFLEKLKTDNLI